MGQVVGNISATDRDGDIISYVIVTGNSQRYFINNQGTIYLIQSLQGTTETRDQLTVAAVDSGSPSRQQNVSVTINIERDNGPPVFQNLPYTTTITHDHTVNSLVKATTAVDSDLKGELVYEIVGNIPAPSFFYLPNENSGRILLRNDLRFDSLDTTR